MTPVGPTPSERRAAVPGAHAAPPARPRGFPEAARLALADTQLRRNIGHATATIRRKRGEVVGELPDWQELREAGRAIKERVLRHLDTYLVELEAGVQRAGRVVHWARDAEECNRIVAAIVNRHGQTEVVKVKSLTTDETRLNEALAAEGIDAWETDLAELIVQLGGDTPSHILVPAIHKNRAEIRELFLRTLDDVDTSGLTDAPASLAEAARLHLARSSSAPGSGSAGRTSRWPRRAPSAWSSPRATAACASPCPRF